MDYLIVNTSVCAYQLWQIKLLYWSFKKVNQSGKFILLISDDVNHHEENNTRFNIKYEDFLINPDIEMFILPDWAKIWQTENNDWYGGIPNKYKSVEWLCETDPLKFKDSDKLLFVDPDMCFIKKIEINDLEDNQIVGQKSLHQNSGFQKFSNLFSDYPDFLNFIKVDAIMYPFVINFFTLKKIYKKYLSYSELIRKRTKEWISEMYALDFACKSENLNIKTIEDLGTCTAWYNDERKIIGNMLHYPNEIKDKTLQKNLFFKQEYTYKEDKNIDLSLTKSTIDNLLTLNLTQSNTDYLYYLKWNFSNILKDYNGESGYLIITLWPGGFNNLRMSFELGVAIAYLTNRKLVLPPKYTIYSPLYKAYEKNKDESGIEDYFQLEETGIKILTFKEFCNIKNLNEDLESVKNISKVLNYDCVANVLNFEQVIPPKDFLKLRKHINAKDYFTNEECIFLDKNLLGDADQTIYTSLDLEIKKLIAKYVRYKPELFDIAWQYINKLKDKSYYAIHIRRNDHQYKQLAVSAETVLENIKDIIPYGSKLYIATDHKDKNFFKLFKERYEVYFYDDLVESLEGKYSDIILNWIPIIEQLICTRSIKFIGNDLSTLSSLVYKMRGYMNDIEDKNYYINTQKFDSKKQCTFLEDKHYIANWARYYKDSWDFNKEKVFVSIASFCDTDVINTIKSLIEEAFDSDRVYIGLHLQDNEDFYKKILSYNFKNLKIKFTPAELTKGVHWARNKIKEELYNNEDYFLQLDSHSRVKKNWDNILINQYKSFGLEKVVISTYPNHFDIPDEEKKYLLKSNNAPLIVSGFFNPNDKNDNRVKVKNIESLKDYEMINTYWISAGFFFTKKQWVKEVVYLDNIRYKGEEDLLTFLSYLKGWNLRLTSEATVWHNYNYKIKNSTDKPGSENPTSGEPYRIHNNQYFIKEEKPIDLLNYYLFECSHEKSLHSLEKYFNIKLKIPDKIDIQITKKENVKVFIWGINESEQVVKNFSKRLIDTANLHNINYQFIGIGKKYIPNSDNNRIFLLEKELNKINESDLIICLDAKDTLINDSLDSIIHKFKLKNTKILISAEKMFTYQWFEFKDKFDKINSPYKYVNSGTYMGYAKDIKIMIQEMSKLSNFKETQVDQGLLGIWVYNNLENSELVQLDSDADIFWVTSAEWNDVEKYYNKAETQKVINIFNNKKPSIIHVTSLAGNEKAYDFLYKNIMNSLNFKKTFDTINTNSNPKTILPKIRDFKKT